MVLLLSILCLEALATQPYEEAAFGADVSLGYSIGNAWAEPIKSSRYGNVLFRYDAFVRDRTTPGPRMGMGLWGAMTIAPTNEMESIDLNGRMMRHETPQQHTGILALIRFDPEAPIAGTFGMGFGRLGFEDAPDGALALPAFTIEAGGRNALPNHTFFDWMLRTHWASHSEIETGALEDWWMVELSTSFGMHLR